MKQGTGLSLSLMWASGASAQRAVDDFCYGREHEAAIGAGAAVEYAAKAVVSHCFGPRRLFSGCPELDPAEMWVAGDFVARAGHPPSPDETIAARAALLDRHTIDPLRAVRRALTLVETSRRPAIRTAAKLVVQSRNAAVHLGDIDVALAELADAFVVAVEAMWSLIPAAAAGQWGVYRDVAKVGLLGRRETWEVDRLIRLTQAYERFYSMGAIFIHRHNAATGVHASSVTCPVCGSDAFFDPLSRQPAPTFVPQADDGTVALLDCTVCGLSLRGPQI